MTRIFFPGTTDHAMPLQEHCNSESDLSCCNENELYNAGAGKFGSNSNLSSSHSMSRYGSESPIRSLLLPEYHQVKTLKRQLFQCTYKSRVRKGPLHVV